MRGSRSAGDQSAPKLPGLIDAKNLKPFISNELYEVIKDLIVFDGIEEKEDKITIYFIEVKTGTSALSQRQKRVMDAVKDKRVEWLRISIKDFGEDVNDLLLPAPE